MAFDYVRQLDFEEKPDYELMQCYFKRVCKPPKIHTIHKQPDFLINP